MADELSAVVGLLSAAAAAPPPLSEPEPEPEQETEQETDGMPQPPPLPLASAFIDGLLRRIEREQGVRILLAAEKSSRIFGTAHRGSDHDIKVIFVYADRRRYCSLSAPDNALPKTETTHPDPPVEVSGWELRHAFNLLAQANPTLLEVLLSPVVYREHACVERMRVAMRRLMDRPAVTRSFLHHAQRNFGQYITRWEGKRSGGIIRKKYGHVIRALLMCSAMLSGGRQRAGAAWPPLPLQELVAIADPPLPPDARDALAVLLRRIFDEQPLGPRVRALDQFIEARVAQLHDACAALPTSKKSSAEAAENLRQWDEEFAPLYEGILWG